MPFKIASQNPIYNNQTPAQRDAGVRAALLATQAANIAAGILAQPQVQPSVTGLAMRAINRGIFM